MVDSQKRIAGVLVLLGLVLSLVPIPVIHVKNGPKEDLKYIRRVWADNTAGQTFTHEYPLDGVSVLLYSKQAHMPVVEIAHENQVIARKQIQVGPQSSWERFWFSQTLPPGQHTISFRSPDITEQDSAVLLRYQVDSDFYEAGNMVVNGEPSYGDLAFRTLEQAPAWRALAIVGQITDKSFLRAMVVLGIGAVISAAVLLGVQAKNQKRGLALLFLALIVGAIAVRIPYAYAIEGVFGGDAFNYLSKAHALTLGNDPFASDPRKGPVYSFLVLPGLFTNDPLMWSRWIGIIAAAATAGITVLIARYLGISWPLAFLSGVLVAVNREFLWESPNGLANTTFVAFAVASVFAYQKVLVSENKKWLTGLCVLLGLTMLTRYEGALLAAVFLPALWVQKRMPLKTIIYSAALTAAVMAIPLVSYMWSGVSGIRTVDDIQSDGGLFLVSSAEGLRENLSRTQGFFGSIWVDFQRLPPVVPPMILGAVVFAGLFAMRQTYPAGTSVVRTTLVLLVFGAVMSLVMMKSNLGREGLIATLFGITGIGFVWLMYVRSRQAIPIALAILLQIAVIIFILPKSRYFLLAVPFFAIALVACLQALVSHVPTRFRYALAVLTASVISVHVFIDGHSALEERVEVYNADASETAVLIDAVRVLRREHGKVGYFSESAELPISIYVPDDRQAVFHPSDDRAQVEQELAFIKRIHTRYLLERDREPQWKVVREYPDAFFVSHVFDSIYGEDQVFVYKVLPDRLP